MVKINKLKKENSAIKFYELKSEPSDKMFVELRSLNDFLSLSVDVFYYEKFYKSGEATLDA